jgi:hypothetical protein
MLCILLGVNQRYFSSKNAVEMFSSHMQEANFKKFDNFLFILLIFLFRPPRLHRKFQPRIFWSRTLT